MDQLSEAAVVRRCCDRLGFSAGGDRLLAAQQHGLTDTIEGYLHPTGTDDGAARTPSPELPSLLRPSKQGNPAAKKQWRKKLRAQQQELTLWWLDRMVAANQPTVERLTWFWHGHFATSVQKVRSASLMLAQNETFRRRGWGDFSELAHAMINDPAMLVWLDGNDNTVAAPNENLSREFMELFSLGHGHYTESDIKQAARALTGWRVDRSSGQARFRPNRHDDQPKTILGSTGDYDADGLVTVLLGRPDCAAFVISRLWFRLVAPVPPAPAVAERLAAAYGPKRNITSVLGAMVTEDAFADRTSSLVKQPVEWLVGLMQALSVRPSGLGPTHKKGLLSGLQGMGQVPFRPPSVGGWPAGSGWLTTAAGLSRLDTARLVAEQADLSEHGRVPAGQRVEQVRRLLGVDEFTTRTAHAITSVADQLPAAIAVGACSPEYTVSG